MNVDGIAQWSVPHDKEVNVRTEPQSEDQETKEGPRDVANTYTAREESVGT